MESMSNQGKKLSGGLKALPSSTGAGKKRITKTAGSLNSDL